MKKLGVCLFALTLALGMPPATLWAAPKSSSPALTTSSVAADPETTIRNFYAQLLDTMKHGDQIGFTGRYKKLDPAIRSAFNLPLMARFSVGPIWSKATPEEQQALISAFSDFSVATYASRFKAFDGEEFVVLGQKPTEGGVIVETQIKPKDGDAVALNYLMRPDEHGALRIVDVFLNGSISELATRRAEFNSIVQRDGLEALVSTLGEKSKQMGPS